MDATALSAHCHCGNLELTFESRLRPEEFPVRACSCSFCSRHRARCTSDPDGRVRIVVHAPEHLSRYRFALGTADFLVCKRCGVYLAAVLTTPDGRSYATVNINAFDARDRFMREAVAVSYDGETGAERRARRAARWTPVVSITEGSR